MIFCSLLSILLALINSTEAINHGWYGEFQQQLEHRLAKRLLEDSLSSPISGYSTLFQNEASCSDFV